MASHPIPRPRLFTRCHGKRAWTLRIIISLAFLWAMLSRDPLANHLLAAANLLWLWADFDDDNQPQGVCNHDKPR